MNELSFAGPNSVDPPSPSAKPILGWSLFLPFPSSRLSETSTKCKFLVGSRERSHCHLLESDSAGNSVCSITTTLRGDLEYLVPSNLVDKLPPPGTP